MKKIKLISSITVASLMSFGFVGCGSNSTDNSTLNNKTISGNVADGYLVGAKVCLDKNTNAKCDTTEPFAITAKNGAYILKNLSSNDINKYPILVEVDQDVIDEDDNKTVSEYYTLSAIAGQRFISPISTMIRNYKITNNVSNKIAKAKIEEYLGIIDTSLTLSDYIKSQSSEANSLHTKAKIIANLKMQVLTNMGNNANLVDAKIVSKYINDKVMAQLSSIKTEVDSNILDLNTSISNVMNNIDLSLVSTELNILSNNINTTKSNSNFKMETNSNNELIIQWNSTTKTSFGWSLLGIDSYKDTQKEIAHDTEKTTVICTKDIKNSYRENLVAYLCKQSDLRYSSAKFILEVGKSSTIFENGSPYATDTYNKKELGSIILNSNGTLSISYK